MNTRGGETASRRVLKLILVIMPLLAIGSQFKTTGSEGVFIRTYGRANEEVALSVQPTSNGEYIIAGWTMSLGMGLSDFWLVKVDSSGNEQWNGTYGGSGKDEAHCVCLTTDGGYAVAGSTESSGAGLFDFWLVKVDGNGNMQWNETYGRSSGDYGFCVQQTNDAGYILAGYTESFGAGESDCWLIKTNSVGIMQWNRTYGGTGLDKAYSVAQTSDGGYVIAGETDSLSAGNSDYLLVRTDSLGAQMWRRTYGGANLDVATSVQQTNDGGFIIAGSTESSGSGGSDGWMVKTDANGYAQWSRPYGDSFDEKAYSVQLMSDGGYLVAGGTTSFTTGGWDFWVITVDPSGNLVGVQKNGGSADEIAYCAQPTSDGGYIAVGFTNSTVGGDSDFRAMKSAWPPPRLPQSDHDIAITSVTPSRTVVGEGCVLVINVTVKNLGTDRETTTVWVYANGTEIYCHDMVFLEARQNQTLGSTWDTLGFARGSYYISAFAYFAFEEPESAHANNTYDDGRVLVTVIGDVQGDMKVNVFDVADLGKAYQSDPSKPNWNSYCDFNIDNKVDSSDLQLLARNFGET